jgi:hypothetical protein
MRVSVAVQMVITGVLRLFAIELGAARTETPLMDDCGSDGVRYVQKISGTALANIIPGGCSHFGNVARFVPWPGEETFDRLAALL